jgi:predicted nucleic acid-binding protein
MTPVVVDASIALAWGLPDESSVYAEAVLEAVEKSALRVPEIWPREIANGLAVAHLRHRLTDADQQIFLDALSRLNIQVEQADASTVIRNGIAAVRYGLTAYDAAYVDLAFREALPLATLDERMRRAAKRSGFAVFEV